MSKAIIFSRVSTPGQVLDSQEQEVQQQALKDGYKLTDLIPISYKESAIKLSIQEREGLQEMFRLIENDTKHKIDCVYVFEISRISRQPEQIYHVRNFLQNHKVQLIIIKPYLKIFESDFSFSQMGNLMLAVFSGVSESEMLFKKERMRRGREWLRQQGKFGGGKCLFGYTTDKDGNFVIDTEKAEIVKRIYQMYNSGNYSSATISRLLYSEGWLQNQTEKSRVCWVIKCLKNTKYFDGTLYPPIISVDDYNRAAELRGKYQNKPRLSYPDNTYLAHRLIFSKTNNHQLIVRKFDLVYKDAESGIFANMNCVDSAVLYAAIWSLKIHSKGDIASQITDIKKELKQIEKRLSSYDTQRKSINDKLERLNERYILGGVSKEKFTKLESQINKDFAKLDADKTNDTTRKDALKNELWSLNDKEEYLASDEEIYNLPKSEMRKIIENEIERVDVLKKERTYYLYVTYQRKTIDSIVIKFVSKNTKITALLGINIEEDVRYVKFYERIRK